MLYLEYGENNMALVTSTLEYGMLKCLDIGENLGKVLKEEEAR